MGREKQLLEDIESGNQFKINLVGRNLQSWFSVLWTHTFILIESTNKQRKTRTYTIWGQQIGNIFSGKLVGVFNHPDDTVHWDWVLLEWSVKSDINIEIPEWTTDWEFVQAIYNEYIDYNKNHQVKFNVLSKPFWGDSSWNCSNLASTILMRASSNNTDIQAQLNNYENLWFDWWIGEIITY
jgi:hypothetical protein